MTLVKRNHNGLFPSLWNDFFNDDWFDRSPVSVRGTVPAVNIKEEDDLFALEVAAPGLKRDDFKVEVDNNVLTISSEMKHEHEEKDDKGTYTRREFGYQSFKRSFTLPDSVAGDKIVAKYEDGVLRVKLPKRDEAKPKPARLIKIS